MSRISEISKQYHVALSESQAQYEDMYAQRVAATQDFYKDFFHNLTCDFGPRFQDERFRARMQDRIERAIGTNALQFIAIDGTCRREIFTDLITLQGEQFLATEEERINLSSASPYAGSGF